MKITYYILTILLFVLLTSYSTQAQGLTISSGATFSLNSSTLSIPGNWIDNGTFSEGSSTVIFSGSSGDQTIYSVSSDDFYNLTINKKL